MTRSAAAAGPRTCQELALDECNKAIASEDESEGRALDDMMPFASQVAAGSVAGGRQRCLASLRRDPRRRRVLGILNEPLLAADARIEATVLEGQHRLCVWRTWWITIFHKERINHIWEAVDIKRADAILSGQKEEGMKRMEAKDKKNKKKKGALRKSVM